MGSDHAARAEVRSHGRRHRSINAGTIYLGTGDACDVKPCDGVFKSTDCGATWSKINTGTLGTELDAGTQWTFGIDFLNPQTLYANSGYGTLGLYRSTNSGVDWTNVTPSDDNAPGFVSRMQMDPDDPEHILIDWHADCDEGGGCIHESTDRGDTWRGIADPSWGGQANIYVLHGSTWVVAPGSGLVRTTNAGETWTSVYDGEAGGHSAGRLYRSPDGAYYIGTTGGVLRSPPGADGTTWSLMPNSGSWVFGITGNDTTLFANSGGVGGFITSPASDGTTWTKMPGESPHHSDGCAAYYDHGHELLYSGCGIDGFHRMRAK